MLAERIARMRIERSRAGLACDALIIGFEDWWELVEHMTTIEVGTLLYFKPGELTYQGMQVRKVDEARYLDIVGEERPAP